MLIKFISQKKEKPVEMAIKRKDKDGKTIYDIKTPFHDPGKKTASLPLPTQGTAAKYLLQLRNHKLNRTNTCG